MRRDNEDVKHLKEFCVSDGGIQNEATECVIWVSRIEKVDISTLRSVFSHDRLIEPSKHIDERLGTVCWPPPKHRQKREDLESIVKS
jgi:hypothetical protein